MLKEHPNSSLLSKLATQSAKVTVCISLYNHQDYICETLESVKFQTLDVLDLVVVEDRSTDDSLTVVWAWLQQYTDRFNRIELIRHKFNAGLAFALNTAISRAETPYVFILDADNLLYPRCVERCLEALESDTQAAMAYPMIERFGENHGVMGNVVWETSRFVKQDRGNTMSLIRKSALSSLEGTSFRQLVKQSEGKDDIWFKLFAADLYGVPVPEILGRKRVCSEVKPFTLKAKIRDSILDDADESLGFSIYRNPQISIIIPVYNKIDYTIRCLDSLKKNLSQDLEIEIIVVNDCSSDNTRELLEKIYGLCLINNQMNSGFIHSCNAGAVSAKGEFLYFLNNDTELLPDSLESLIEVFQTHEDIGVVGSKLIYPNGALQEAGGIIFKDGSGWNYGRNENPYDPKYNFLRSVDYCSGASLLVKREVFERLGGFELEFAPAYYEDTDLCFAVRHRLGLEVMYQPKSEVIHYEGVSSGTSTSDGAKRYQVVNLSKFRSKWSDVLERYPANLNCHENVHRATRRFQGKKTILVIDSYLPCHDKESGSRRLFQILKIFNELQYHVIFLPDDMLATEPYLSELQAMGIEALYTCSGYGALQEEQLRERLPLIDAAWVCRPELMKQYLPILREHSGIKVIYDTIDLHYLRMKRKVELGWTSEKSQRSLSWIDMQALELKMATQADLTLTTTYVEKDTLNTQGVENVEVVPNIHTPYTGPSLTFNERSGILFIGGYNHPPNVDAVEWLCHEIMPEVWKILPDVKVTLLGSNPPECVKQLACDRVLVPGYMPDVSSYFLSSRIFVSPLRYGAGMKGKIGQSLEFRLPIISTSIGVEGMCLIDNRNVLVANDSINFSMRILDLYSNKDVWNSLSSASKNAIKDYSKGSVKKRIEFLLGRVI